EAGLDAAAVASGIAAGGGVPGRLERIEAGQDFVVVVDYAHKPDAVEAAARLADLVVVTDDNPRTEDPATIRAALLAGVDPDALAAGRVLEVGDRRTAIREAVRRAAPGDIVLVAGKGHETGQEVQGVVHPFDDREVAREELACLR